MHEIELEHSDGLDTPPELNAKRNAVLQPMDKAFPIR